MRKAKKAFSRFYTTAVEIYRIKSNSTYYEPAKTELVCSVLADIQPYESGLHEEEYGLRVERMMKMYCEECGDVREGNYASADGEIYRIKSVKRWNMGIEALLEKSGI